MNRLFGNYNDYELLYLIKDGNEKALEYMFKKYDILIYKIASSLYFKSDKLEDLLQEGRMVLYYCIYNYNENQNINFYGYFTICLKRTYYKLLKTDYYTGLLVNEDKIPIDIVPDNKNYIIFSGNQLFNDEMYIMLFDECIIGDLNLTDFANKHNLTYSMVYYKYKKMVLALKEIFSLD